MSGAPFKVKAVYEYSSPHEDDLSFPNGQIITVTDEEDADWYNGEYIDASGQSHTGLFPKNFVEKYEPAVPARPSRPVKAKHAETPAAAPAVEEEPQLPAESQREEPEPAPSQTYTAPTQSTSVPEAKEPLPLSPVNKESTDPPAAPKPAPAAPAAASAKSPPPAVAEKPSSFRDRIAAFNKPAAAPVAPFKPTGFTGGFVKKPFVAPPPSKDAYVPPPREIPPTRIYRREEDPEIAERQHQDQAQAETAGLAPAPGDGEEAEDAPKPTSLKERIAMLQKQQLEAAQRRADVAHKEKPKKPPKRRPEHAEQEGEVEPANLDRIQSGEATERGSSEAPRESVPHPHPHRRPSQLEREPLSDANDADQSAAGETTEDADLSTEHDDSDDKPRPNAPALPTRAPGAPAREPEVGDEEDDTEEAEEDDEMDEETRRRLELRERMAKMSGGMGMAGMFGPPGGMPMPGMGGPRKPKTSTDRHSTAESSVTSPQSPPQRVPMIPIPGMPHMKSPEREDRIFEVEKEDDQGHTITEEHRPEEVADIEDLKHEAPPRASSEREAPPPVPRERPEAPNVSTANRTSADLGSRPVPPPPPPADVRSPSEGSASDDELSLNADGRSAETPTGNDKNLPIRAVPPPVPGPASPTVPSRATPHSPQAKRTSYFGGETMSPTSPTASTTTEKRSSRLPPPIPGAGIPTSPQQQARAPPPPPPGAPPSRQSTMEMLPPRLSGRTEEETEYEGDYDTDIAPGATHKDALKAHAREASLDDSTTADDTPSSPPLPPAGSRPPPPIPGVPPRAVPPPPPEQPPRNRQSTDIPRAAPPPPPVPISREVPPEDDDEYDPYRYTNSAFHAPPPPPSQAPPMPGSAAAEDSEEDMYNASPPRRSVERAVPPPPPQAPPYMDRAPPPPPPPAAHAPDLPPMLPPPGPPPPTRAPPRQSAEIGRSPTTARRSLEQSRPAGDHGYIARDVDLSQGSQWWAQPNVPPPVFQNRPDVLYEIEESTTSKRGGRTMVSKDVYILFMDYSQTIVTARFDSRDVSDVQLEQRHEPPPPRLRQDQLEDAHMRYGKKIAEAVAAKQNSVVGDGTPHALVLELLRPLTDALLPVGTRAYGALVYANLANASVQQFDEIRPGDIITLRNAKLQGKHGSMHSKYSMEVGKPDHVGVVMDWDGTKKKVHAYEQGRENKKVKVESFRFGDLKSGEIRVWRVMDRGWVNWGTA